MKIIILIFAFCFMSNCNAQFISEDDLLHFGAGAIIASATYAIVYGKTKNKKKAFWYSLGAATLAGLTKELFDVYVVDGRFDTGEIIATVAGGLVASYTFHVFTGKKKRKKKKIERTN